MEIQTGADAGTILIVEDDKEIRQGIEIFLKGQGYIPGMSGGRRHRGT